MSQDIDQAIGSLVADWRGRPFAWGTADCCQFAREAAWRLHGIVVDAPAYISEREAVRTLASLGGFVGLLKSAGLQSRRAVIAARRGDFVLYRNDTPGLFGEGLALVTGLGAHAPTDRGLIEIQRPAWLQVWGVD